MQQPEEWRPITEAPIDGTEFKVRDHGIFRNGGGVWQKLGSDHNWRASKLPPDGVWIRARY